MPKNLCRIKKLGVFLAFILLISSLSSCAKADSGAVTEAEAISLHTNEGVSSKAPEVSAKAAIGIEASSGEIFFQKNIDQRLPMASTTKIMTAIVALEYGNLSDNVKIDRRAVGIEGSSIYLYEGEILTLSELLYATLLSSANDAATAVAIHIGGDVDTFVDMMNQKAGELGLDDTHFDNPHGLDGDEHYTTARELGIIAMHAMKNPTFREIVSTYRETIPMRCGEGVRLLINHNKLLRSYDGAIGIKTGYTKKSGRCLVSASSRDGVELICVTLDAPSDWQDHTSILDFGNSLYETKSLAIAGSSPISLPVCGGDLNEIPLTVQNEITISVRRDSEIKAIIEAPRFLYAPVTDKTVVGKIIFIQDERVIAESPLITSGSITRIKNNAIFGR